MMSVEIYYMTFTLKDYCCRMHKSAQRPVFRIPFVPESP